MLQVTLVRNREDRPRFVTLVRYEQRWVPSGEVDEYGEPMEQLQVAPVRRTMEWVRSPDGYEYFICTRVTELPFRAIKPQQAHRDLVAQWKRHLDTIKDGATPIKVEVVP
jgi:hypothetical protein